MSGWVKWEKDLETDPRFVRLTRHVRALLQRDESVTSAFPPGLVTQITAGCLVKFWAFADTHIRQNDQLDLGFADIDELVSLRGFAEGMPDDWLVEIDSSTVELPGYQEHNGVEARKRDLAQKRQERRRTKLGVTPARQERDDSVTGALPDQTRPDQTIKSRGRAPKSGATPATPIPSDFRINDTNRAWLKGAGLSDRDIAEVVGEFVRWAHNSELKYKNWQLVFSRNPKVKSAVGRHKTNGSRTAAESAAKDERDITELGQLLRVVRGEGEDWASYRTRVVEANERRLERARSGAGVR